MGFRTLREFNEAMLAKQGLRLMKNPNSLVAKILKAKYYPKTKFLHSKLGNNPSYLLRSLIHYKWVLDKGSCWIIGNGEGVNIWDDNWILNHRRFKILTHKPLDTTVSGVRDLIYKENNYWNKHPTVSLFSIVDQEAIKRILILDPTEEDNLCWMDTKDGRYKVNYGYYCIKIWEK